MAFKDVKQNYSVYILNKQDITITDGKVISVGFPHLDLSTKPAMGQSQMVVDITIEANSKIKSLEARIAALEAKLPEAAA